MPTLPRPEDPLPLAARWLADAQARVPKNPWAMALATVSAEGRPALRYVLLKSLSTSQGYAVFFTNYGSRKAAELDSSGRAAGALYWPDAGRQLRLEGRAERSPEAESDACTDARQQSGARDRRQPGQECPPPQCVIFARHRGSPLDF